MAVTDVTLSVDNNQRAIHQVRAEVERREVELPVKVRSIVKEVLEGAREPLLPGPRHRPLGGNVARPVQGEPRVPVTNIDEAYDTARKSLRLWPVSKEGDIATRTREFLVNELLLDQQYATGLNFTVRRTAGPSRGRDKESPPRVRDEVLVIFQSSRERDEVRSHARNLEKKGRGLRPPLAELPSSARPCLRIKAEKPVSSKECPFRRRQPGPEVGLLLRCRRVEDSLSG